MSALRGFGITLEVGNAPRQWYAGDDGVRRWADNNKPVDIETPEAPMKIDLGHPLQDHDEPKPFDFDLSPADRHTATIAKIDLERQRRAANKRDADQELTKLGVVFTDGDAA